MGGSYESCCYKGPKDVAVEEVDDPKIENPRDAIIKLTSTAICGSDLHMYDGRTVAEPGTVLGHEPLGVVEEVGDAVTSFNRGDRVVVTFNIPVGTALTALEALRALA